MSIRVIEEEFEDTKGVIRIHKSKTHWRKENVQIDKQRFTKTLHIQLKIE